MSTAQSLKGATDNRLPKRQRYTVRLRHLNVVRVEQISRSMVRVTLSGPELEGFVSLGFDDHVKMFFVAPGETTPRLPHVGPNGLEMPENGPRPLARDYTPRHYDPVKQELQIDFALHQTGPASDWARQAAAGQSAWVAGPRGSFLVPFEFDWHLLISDETGLPALARRLEEMPAGTRALAVIEVDGPQDEIALQTEAAVDLVWVHRNGASAGETQVLVDALKNASLPDGDYFTWIGCESQTAKQLRNLLVEERGANPKWLRASGYWRRGASGVHDHFDE
jgi:NADPH-dependent ferric siderophore reductase